jgi:hypothetical protein
MVMLVMENRENQHFTPKKQMLSRFTAVLEDTAARIPPPVGQLARVLRIIRRCFFLTKKSQHHVL